MSVELRSSSPSEFKVYAIRYAHRETSRGEHFYGHDECCGESMPIDYFVWLAVSSTEVVVIDTGFTKEMAERRGGREYFAAPIETMKEIGIEADMVKHVILTHLHYDHTGTARDFPDAQYVLQKREMNYWTGPYASRIPQNHRLVYGDDLSHLINANLNGRVSLVDGDSAVVPGIDVHLVGGHTPGMQVVSINTSRGTVVLTSDASHFYANIEDDRPFSIVHCLADMYEAFDRINEIADGPECVVAGHDPLVLSRYPALDPSYADRVVMIA